MMKRSNEHQKFVAKLADIAFDDRLEETLSTHSQELMAEKMRLVGDTDFQNMSAGVKERGSKIGSYLIG